MRKFYLFCSAVVALMLLAFSTETTAQEKPLITFACVSDLHAQQDFITDQSLILTSLATAKLEKQQALVFLEMVFILRITKVLQKLTEKMSDLFICRFQIRIQQAKMIFIS